MLFLATNYLLTLPLKLLLTATVFPPLSQSPKLLRTRLNCIIEYYMLFTFSKFNRWLIAMITITFTFKIFQRSFLNSNYKIHIHYLSVCTRSFMLSVNWCVTLVWKGHRFSTLIGRPEKIQNLKTTIVGASEQWASTNNRPMKNKY